jgi:hypothetical protein
MTLIADNPYIGADHRDLLEHHLPDGKERATSCRRIGTRCLTMTRCLRRALWQRCGIPSTTSMRCPRLCTE